MTTSTWKSFRKWVKWTNYDVKHHGSRIPHFRFVVEWKQDLCLRTIIRSDLSRKQWRVPGASPRCCVGTHAQEYKGMIECRASELYVPVLSMWSKMEVKKLLWETTECSEGIRRYQINRNPVDASQIVRERQTKSSGVSDGEKTNRRTGETDEEDGYRMSLCSWEVLPRAIRTQVSLQWALWRQTRRSCETSRRKLRCIKKWMLFQIVTT